MTSTQHRIATGQRAPAHLHSTALLVGLLALGVSGCASSSPGAAPSTSASGPGAGRSVERLADGTSFLVSGPSNGNHMAAIVRGTLAVIGGGCLGFDDPGGNGTVVLVLPHGSRPTADGSAVEVAGGPTVRIGDAVEGGGGYRDQAEEGGVVASGWPDAPEACRSARSLAGIDDVESSEG